MTTPYIYPTPHEVAETVDITVRMSRAGFEKLCRVGLPVSEIWLTEQPDGSYALGVVTAQHPSEYGLEARAVSQDDILERFPGGIPR